jgi:hypothetical protein
MANHQAIAATGQAILGLLSESCPKPEFAGAKFELYQPENFSLHMEEGISLYLYRVGVNASLRNMPPVVGADGKQKRPPLPLDLYYVMTAWAKTAVKQQRLLGWAIRTLEDVTILPSTLLNNYSPEPDIFQPNETVELIFDSLTLQDWSNLWNSTKTSPTVSIAYIARIINIESQMTMTTTTFAQTREFGFAKVE